MNQTQLDLLWCDPGHWRLGLFYFCRRDPRLVVPKRVRGLGWTLNLARPLALPFAALIVAAVVHEGRKPRSRFADLLIAATAHANRLDLYSRNADDFSGLDELIHVVAI